MNLTEHIKTTKDIINFYNTCVNNLISLYVDSNTEKLIPNTEGKVRSFRGKICEDLFTFAYETVCNYNNKQIDIRPNKNKNNEQKVEVKGWLV